MTAYIVCYDLMKQGQNYECVIKKLESFPSHFHMQGSVWIVLAEDNAHVRIRDQLQGCLDQNDRLFVGKLSAAAWKLLTPQANQWLVDNIR